MTEVQTCALPISLARAAAVRHVPAAPGGGAVPRPGPARRRAGKHGLVAAKAGASAAAGPFVGAAGAANTAPLNNPVPRKPRRKMETRERNRTRGITWPASSDSRSDEHTSELQSPMRISYTVSCLTKKHQ